MCQSTIVYEHCESAQVLYVIPVSSILGRLPLVPVSNTGTIPYEMRREAADIPDASCDKTKDCKDSCRWWYMNSWALICYIFSIYYGGLARIRAL